MRSTAVGTLFVLSMLGCDGGGDEGPWTLRPNVVEVIGGQSTFGNTTIIDGDRDGDRIALLRSNYATQSFDMYLYIALSEDGGKTWRDVPDPKSVGELGGDTFQRGVHLEDGRVFLLLSADAGNMFSVWRVFEVDVATGETMEIPVPLTRTGFYLEHNPDGGLRWVLVPGPPYLAYDMHPAAGTVTVKQFGCSTAACGAVMFESRDRGDTWDGYTLPSPMWGACMSHLDIASNTETEACVHRPVWPTTGSEFHMAWGGSTAYMAWSPANDPENGQGYATALQPGTPPTVTETLQLGPGVIHTWGGVGTLPRRRFADFTFLEYLNGSGVGTLARISDAGAERADFPITPCNVEDGCGYADPPTFGYGQVQWIMPDDNGAYLVFYTTVVDAKGAQSIYMAREKPTLGPVRGGEPPPVTTVDLPPGAQPMNELERACAVWAQCELFPTFLYKQCLDRWTTDRASSPGLAAARARFIAAATSCASLDAVDSSGCPLECTEHGGSCGAGGTGPCSIEVSYVSGNCGTCDGSGDYIACTATSNRAFAVACGGGTACSPGAGCALQGSSPCDSYQPTPSCVGSAVQTCNGGSNILTVADCSLAGATCGATTATCVPTSTEGACSTQTYGAACASATHLLQCSFGQIKYLACSDLGFTECIDGPNGAICH